jgi:outer membrane receptor protein involved in Fe transport
MRGTIRARLLLGSAVCLLPALVNAQATQQPTPSIAATAPAGDAATPAPAADEIVVTGSHIIRNGFQAPTPVSVVTVQEIQKSAPVVIADYVNQLPALSGSTSPRTSTGIAGGTGGANLLNLRNLGPNRTLVLLDGRRVTPSTLTGAVDINTLPSGLIQRVDVVTGGASASYGSDAVAGVVNFILDTKFEGIKGTVQAGATTRGDGGTHSADLSVGKAFADGRGHIVLSGQYSSTDAVLLGDGRGWYKGYKVLANPHPGNGQPTNLILPNSSLNLTDAGLIVSGPLRGTAFNSAGGVATTNFPFGSIESGLFQSGGTQNADPTKYLTLLTPVKQGTAFGHVSYDFTDNITGYIEGSYGDSHTRTGSGLLYRFGTAIIQRDNYYLPASVRAQMTSAGVTNFGLWTDNLGLGQPIGVNRRQVARITGGLDGKIGSHWTWNAYGQHGVSKIRNAVDQDINVGNYSLAIDAVNNPATGNPICRSTLTNPANGCVPLNPLGVASLTSAQRAWLMGTAEQNIRIQEDIGSVSVQGDLFNLPAGAVSLAFGGEYRNEAAHAGADPTSLISSWYVGNYKPFRGSYNVKEGFAELLIPLLKNSPIGKSLAINLGGRVTNYSTSGTVETWKAGFTYQPVDDLRLRFTRSRDIRAPNLNDLFLGGVSLALPVTDPFRNNQPLTILQVTSGNPNLKPEIASSLTGGIVYSPHWFNGFSLSIDYYDIKIRDAIATSAAPTIINLCFQGNQAFCGVLHRDASGTLTEVDVVPFNAQSEKARGIDFEADYRTGLGSGQLQLRALVNYVNQLKIVTPTGVITRAGEAGDNLGIAQGVPHWRGLVEADYDVGPLSVQLKGRFIGAAKTESDYTPAQVNINNVPAIFYLDTFIGYDVKFGNSDAQLFIAMDNVLDKSPPVDVSNDTLNSINSGTNPALYDAIGRDFRVGVRFKL